MSNELLAGTFDNPTGRLLTLWVAPAPSRADQRSPSQFIRIIVPITGIASPHFEPTYKETSMKRCNACDEEFDDKFSFCPVDATPLNGLAAEVIGQTNSRNSPLVVEIEAARVSSRAVRTEFHLTMIDNASLPERLTKEVSYLGSQLRLSWPELKRDPITFCRRLLVETRRSLRRALATPNSLTALASAIVLVLTVGLIVVLIGNRSSEESNARAANEREVAHMVQLPSDSNVNPEDPGIGAGSKSGRVGFAGKKGEGSGPTPRKSTGGGTGGQRDPLPAQVGKLPPPSEISAPIPKFPPVQKQTLPVAGIDIDPALWKNLPAQVYGDPRSTSSTPSGGPGDKGGMGTHDGTGIGEGVRGSGFGPGQDGNIEVGRRGWVVAVQAVARR